MLLGFSHSFDETHLAIAVRHPEPLEAIIAALRNRDVLLVIAGVLAAASLVGAVYYVLETLSSIPVTRARAASSRVSSWGCYPSPEAR